MTSIEWLIDQLTNVERPNYTNKRILAISKNSLQEKRVNELVEQAKEMHKQEIIDAWNGGDYAYFYSKETDRDFADGSDYYQETFKTDKL